MDMHEPGCAGGELLHYLQRQGDSLRTEIFEAAPLCCAEHLRDVDLTVPRVDTKLKLKPSKADMKTLRPLLRAHEEAMEVIHKSEFGVSEQSIFVGIILILVNGHPRGGVSAFFREISAFFLIQNFVKFHAFPTCG